MSAIRTLISRWVEAYQDLDAKRLAALETPDVEIVDRFGELHLPSGRNENEKLWSDAFAIVSRNTPPPTVTIGRTRFLRPDVAVVQVSWRFATPGSSQRQAMGPLTGSGSAGLMPTRGKEGRRWPMSSGFMSACQ